MQELLAARGVEVSYESIQKWCLKFPPSYAKKLRKPAGQVGDIWYLDEVFINIRGERALCLFAIFSSDIWMNIFFASIDVHADPSVSDSGVPCNKLLTQILDSEKILCWNRQVLE